MSGISIDCMDIDDEWTLQDITTQIIQYRENKTLFSNQDDFLEVFPPALPEKCDKPLHRAIVVVDTNFLISHLSFVKTLVYEYAKAYQLIVIVPWIVLQELDGLKTSQRKSDLPGTGPLNQFPQQVNLSTLAKTAIAFLHNCFMSKQEGVRGQKLDEKLEKSECNDDKILDCCRYFKSRTKCSTTLLSNDKNLCVKAMVHEIPTASYQNLGKGLDGIFERILENVPKSPLPSITLQDRIYHSIVENDCNSEETIFYTLDEDTVMLDSDEIANSILEEDTSQGSENLRFVLKEDKPLPTSKSVICPLKMDKTLYSSIHAPRVLKENDHMAKNFESQPVVKHHRSLDSTLGGDEIVPFYSSLHGEEDKSLYSSMHAPIINKQSTLPKQNPNSFSYSFNSSENLVASQDMSHNLCIDIIPSTLANRNLTEKLYMGPVFTNPQISEEILEQSINLAQIELVDNVIILLASCLPNAIKHHFNELLGDCWTYAITEPEPWSLANMLKFIDRYWISVFSDVFDQSYQIKNMAIRLHAFVKQWQQNQRRNYNVGGTKVLDIVTFLQTAEVILRMVNQNIVDEAALVQITHNWWKEFHHTL
ncbi:hypothetical protein G9A89_023912 [Geosiphon pyriformis]|nr:hypothetical protein G9A89_023912 [Geosiphon pyriformis]